MFKLKNQELDKNSIKFNHKKVSNNEIKSKNFSHTSPVLNSGSDNENVMDPSTSKILKNATSNVFFGEKIKNNLNVAKPINTGAVNNTNNLSNYIKNLDINNNKSNQSNTNNNNNNMTSFPLNNNTNQFYKSDGSQFKADNYPSLVTPQVGLNNNSSDDFNNKQMINLEDVCIQEEKLWKILEVANILKFSVYD